jgi:hypothetical protein
VRQRGPKALCPDLAGDPETCLPDGRQVFGRPSHELTPAHGGHSCLLRKSTRQFKDKVDTWRGLSGAPIRCMLVVLRLGNSRRQTENLGMHEGGRSRRRQSGGIRGLQALPGPPRHEVQESGIFSQSSRSAVTPHSLGPRRLCHETYVEWIGGLTEIELSTETCFG